MKGNTLLLLRFALLACAIFSAKPARAGQPVSLPYILHDDFGSTWDVQYDGSIGDGGNDLYDGGGRIFINNAAQYVSPNQQAVFDAAHNELTFPPMPMGPVTVSRRVACFKTLGCIRFIETLENTGPSPVHIQLRAYFNLGGTVQQAIPLLDEKRPGRQPVGYAFGDQNNGVAMIGAGRGSKVLPRFQYQQNNDNIDCFYEIDVPARSTVAVVHCQLRRKVPPSAAEAWKSLSERELLKDLPKDLRKRIVNFPGGDAFIGDIEILRGDVLDVLELRGGDAYRGMVKIDAFRLQTIYGPITLPADNVICLINVGTYRPTQLLVTADGDVFGGRLDITSLKLQLTSGQYTNIPLSQITRLGFHRRPGEVEEWNLDTKSLALLRTGERLRINIPPAELNLATPSGLIRLNPAIISSVVFASDENVVPQVHLVDGSKLSGLLSLPAFDLALAKSAYSQPPVNGSLSASVEQRVRIPSASLLRMNFVPEQEPDALPSTLTLTNQDVLYSQLTGSLALETRFDTLHIEGSQIKQLRHTSAGALDIQITLWDDSTLSGKLVETHLTCLLRCGVTLRIPIALVEEYHQPLPQPSPKIIQRIHQVARDLDADEFRQREWAQEQILSIGPSVLSILKQIQKTAPPEAVRRIEVITLKLTRELEKPGPNGMTRPDEDEGIFDNGPNQMPGMILQNPGVIIDW